MSVTLTRRQVIELGEKAIESLYIKPPEGSPEVEAFRQVLRLGTRFARGCMTNPDGAKCPMMQTIFDSGDNEVSCDLAFAWDAVTRSAGLRGEVTIEVNSYIDGVPYTEADVHRLLTDYDRGQS